MSNIQQIDMTSPGGVTLNTAGKYCRCNLQVVPKLLPITVRKNGVYPVPDGHAGHGQVSVNVAGKPEGALSATKNGSYTPPEGTVYSAVEVAVPIKEEITLVVTKNGTYTAPEGKVFTSIVVNIPQTEQGGTLTPPDTNSFTIKVGGTFSIPYEGSSPTVECPGCLDYYIDGGIIVFTGAAVGSGTIYLRDSDTLIGQYTVIVTEASHVHQYTSTVVPPTCVAGGYTVKTCACGDSVTGSFTAAKGHTWGIPYYGNEFSSGYGHKCAVCGELDELSVPTCNHFWEFSERVAPDCENEGYDLFICSLCGAKEKDNYVTAKGHTWGAPYYSGDFSSGYGHKCTVCGALDELSVPGTGGEHIHSYTAVITQPTCTAVGYTTHTCVCGDSYKNNETAVLGHTYANGVCIRCGVSENSGGGGGVNTCTHPEESVTEESSVAATCVKDGSVSYWCTACDHKWTDTIAALGHDWGNPYFSNDFSSGYGHKCSRCGELEELSHTHVYTATVKEPTCTDGGYTTHTCSCGDSYTDSETAKLGHLAGEPQLTNTPTCQVCGHYKVYCTRCNELLNEYDDDGNFAEHAWCDPIVFEPTCTSAGYTRVVCDTCGTLTDTPGDPALGHDYQLVSDSSQSSGAAMKCTRCGHSYETDYDCDILGHETDDGTYDVDGEPMYKCKHCGEYYLA